VLYRINGGRVVDGVERERERGREREGGRESWRWERGLRLIRLRYGVGEQMDLLWQVAGEGSGVPVRVGIIGKQLLQISCILI